MKIPKVNNIYHIKMHKVNVVNLCILYRIIQNRNSLRGKGLDLSRNWGYNALNTVNWIKCGERMWNMAEKNPNLRDALIREGLNEINKNGVAEFSMRRVAEACGVSCAAPYKHFKDKRDLVAAIIDYVNEIWAARQEEIVAGCSDSLREQIIEISVQYVRFLMDNPDYRAVLMLKDEEFDNLYHKKRTSFGSLSQTLAAQLYGASGLDRDTWERKMMICRSLIFGVVFLFDAGEFAYNETNLGYLRYTLNREFETL